MRSYSIEGLANRDLVLIVGQSNCAGYMRHISEWPVYAREEQPAVHYCCDVQVSGMHIQRSWAHMAPIGSGKDARLGTFPSTIGPRLLRAGWSPAIAHYAITSTASSYWLTNYTTLRDWYLARAAELALPRIRGLIIYQGEAQSATWATDWATILAGLRTAFAIPTMPCAVVKIPRTIPILTAEQLAATWAQQEAFVAADDHAGIVEDPVAVHWDPTHIDGASAGRIGEKIADVLIRLW